jgi:hypothetical protein
VTCPACESSKQRPHTGVYHFQCLECCARLVASTYPSKRHAAAMLAAIERFPQSPGRAEVLACVDQLLTKRRSVPPKCTTDS